MDIPSLKMDESSGSSFYPGNVMKMDHRGFGGLGNILGLNEPINQGQKGGYSNWSNFYPIIYSYNLFPHAQNPSSLGYINTYIPLQKDIFTYLSAKIEKT